MKKILLIVILLPFIGFSQTRTSIANGNFLNPAIWTPFGIPSSGETVIINHAVILNVSVYYTSGSITINAGASLIEDATERSFWADGTGSVVNNGTFTAHLLALSPGASFTNTGNFINIDSLWNRGTITNSGTATLFDFWNDLTGNFYNSGNLANSDSLLNQGSFINSGTASIYDLLNDQFATFDNSGAVTITNNMNNQGYVNNPGTMDLGNDFGNCNTQTMNAKFVNDGVFCIGNDFLNCDQDSLTGTGYYHIGNLSSNLGVFSGNFFFGTPTGSLSFNSGTIEPTITFTTVGCNLGFDPIEEMSFDFYPNPAEDVIQISVTSENYQIYDLAGKLLVSGEIEDNQIDVSALNSGIYMIDVEGYIPTRFLKE